MERWKDIVGYECLYRVSDKGEVKSLGKGKSTNPMHSIEKPVTKKMKNGYYQVKLFRDGERKHFSVHRLVAAAFVENTQSFPQVNHIDGVKTNNCSTNLEWVTASQNVKHSFDVGLAVAKRGKDNKQSKPVLQIDLHGNIVREWESIKQILREAGYNTVGIIKCCRKEKRYKTAYGFKWEYKCS